jgi:UDP-3-O-acyl N-acetylglucosamine deacetylase
MLQRTIAKEIDVSGISLHLGLDSNLKFKPAEPNTGVVFIRIDLPDSPQIKATVNNATTGFVRQTSIGNQDANMHTIEHVMSALAGLGIDNIIIESNCQEPPAMDGSAIPFVEALQNAGIIEQDVEKKEIAIEDAISIIDKDKELVITPSDKCRITYVFKQDDPINVMQMVSFEFGEESFIKEIAPARTFCFRSEVELLKSKGLGKGGSNENVVVVNDDGKSDQPSRLDNRRPLPFGRYP